MNLSRVLRYLTLSLASLAASVIATSRAFHRRSSSNAELRTCSADVAYAEDDADVYTSSVIKEVTAMKGLDLSCSVMEVSSCMRALHSSIMPRGPCSSCTASRAILSSSR